MQIADGLSLTLDELLSIIPSHNDNETIFNIGKLILYKGWFPNYDYHINSWSEGAIIILIKGSYSSAPTERWGPKSAETPFSRVSSFLH